jgi:hypothetical protein
VLDDLDIYNVIAAAVAERREPNFSSSDLADVGSAMQRALASPDLQANFAAWLAGQVQDLSNGTVTLEPVESDALDQQDNGLLLRVVTAGEPFAEPVSITAGETPVRWTMRGGARSS